MAKDIVFCKGGGCTAKLGPGVLEKVLSKLPKGNRDENLLVGFDSCDDAAVYRLSDDLAAVQTLDFFPPMVDDPYLFGKIAAANALSDIYAMGGEVKTALNIVCFPEQMDLNILGKILQGGQEKVTEAGGILAGGHSIMDDGVKYGLSVMGTIHPDHILKNDGARKGDLLILTKPLGVGIICAANRVGEAGKEAMDQALNSMTALNKYAALIAKAFRVHGCTDVTGFGLLGHLHEMLHGRFSAEIFCGQVPYIKEAYDYAGDFLITAAGQRNRNHVGPLVEFCGVPFAMEEILFDPQTSGGLLFSVDPEDGEAMLREIKKLKLPCGIIGRIIEKKDKEIYVKI